MTLRERLAAARRRAAWGDWSDIVRLAAAPGVILILFAITVSISLGALLYAQHTSSSIVQHDMRVATSLSEIAARFDHDDGDLYRLMVDKAAGGTAVDIPTRSAAIKAELAAIGAKLRDLKPSLRPSDQRRTEQVLRAVGQYSEAVDVVSAMLDINFAASAAMLAPFRSNADQVIVDVNAMVAAGIADARQHAALSAGRTRWLVATVAVAMVLLAVLAVAWLAIASYRGLKLGDEMRLRQTAERNALVLARHDPLTGLVNRRVFVGEVERRIAEQAPFAILLVDLDNFKAVNDLYGHAAGDAVLKGMAQRLLRLDRDGAMLARLGGDEFAAVLPHGSAAQLTPIAAALTEQLGEPVTWNGVSLHVGGSVGAALFPSDATAVDTLLHAADVAMYDAKRATKGAFRLFSNDLELARLEQRRVEDELRVGIAEGEVQPFYQPIVRLADRRVCGFEILARWRHPGRGLLTPDLFIGVAERTRQIDALTDALLSQACRDLHRLPPGLTFSLNVSPGQLSDPDLAPRLIGIVRDAGHPPERFEIELTEDAVIEDIDLIERTIAAFRASGMTVALDDFGTGFSSLSNLQRLRFDRIKIDRSFVGGIGDGSRKLVDAIMRLASSFDMAVTAEGIEDDDTALALARMNCDLGQGYLFGKPRPISEVLEDFVRDAGSDSARSIRVRYEATV